MHGIGGNVVELELGRRIDTRARSMLSRPRGSMAATSRSMASRTWSGITLRRSSPCNRRGRTFWAAIPRRPDRGGAGAAAARGRRGGGADRPDRQFRASAHLPQGGTPAHPAARRARCLPPHAVRRSVPLHHGACPRSGRRRRASSLLLANLPAAANTAALRRVHRGGASALEAFGPFPMPARSSSPTVSIFPVPPAWIWRGLVGGMELHRVGRDHDSLMRADTPALAAALARALRRAEAP